MATYDRRSLGAESDGGAVEENMMPHKQSGARNTAALGTPGGSKGAGNTRLQQSYICSPAFSLHVLPGQ